MAPIDFENNIKDKLDERMLKPSTDAWGKLSERLDNQDKKNNKKKKMDSHHVCVRKFKWVVAWQCGVRVWMCVRDVEIIWGNP